MTDQHVESMAQYLAMTAGRKWDSLTEVERGEHRNQARQVIAEKEARKSADEHR